MASYSFSTELEHEIVQAVTLPAMQALGEVSERGDFYRLISEITGIGYDTTRTTIRAMTDKIEQTNLWQPMRLKPDFIPSDPSDTPTIELADGSSIAADKIQEIVTAHVALRAAKRALRHQIGSGR